MRKKLTITIDEHIYNGLYATVGKRRISRFIEDLVRSSIVTKNLESAYKRMAEEEKREIEALEWAEATIQDVSNETR